MMKENSMIYKQKSVLIRSVRLSLSAMFIIYVIFLSYLTFFSHFYGRSYVHRDINLIPFKTFMLFLKSSFNIEVVLTNIIGNVAAFVPMGLFLPIIFHKSFNLRKTIVFLLLATTTVEVIQYVAAVGTLDIDDIILNFVGGLFGFILSRPILKYLPK